jgi:hypothetical protein
MELYLYTSCTTSWRAQGQIDIYLFLIATSTDSHYVSLTDAVVATF